MGENAPALQVILLLIILATSCRWLASGLAVVIGGCHVPLAMVSSSQLSKTKQSAELLFWFLGFLSLCLSLQSAFSVLLVSDLMVVHQVFESALNHFLGKLLALEFFDSLVVLFSLVS